MTTLNDLVNDKGLDTHAIIDTALTDFGMFDEKPPLNAQGSPYDLSYIYESLLDLFDAEIETGIAFTGPTIEGVLNIGKQTILFPIMQPDPLEPGTNALHGYGAAGSHSFEIQQMLNARFDIAISDSDFYIEAIQGFAIELLGETSPCTPHAAGDT